MKAYMIILTTVFSLFFIGCDKNSHDTGSEQNSSAGVILSVGSPISQGHPERVKNILFAHGYHDNKSRWDAFSEYIKDNYSDWKVYKTDVDPNATIENRGEELAKYIASLDSVDDDSLLTVGHSMGGLDLHYVVSMGNLHEGEPENIYYKAAKKIHKIYTLATPHGGNQFGGQIAQLITDDGGLSLGTTQMREFNQKYPYSNFSINSRDIPLLAFRFHCGDKESAKNGGPVEPSDDTDSDGTVAVSRQILFGAPYTQSIFHGKHTFKPPNNCISLDLETDNTTLLKGILDNTDYLTDTKDIVFYEKNSCSGGEKGIFSSTYKPKSLVNCHDDDHCDDDEIRSVMIYPGIAKNTLIWLYDDKNGQESDDWAVINVGNANFSEPICINDLEKPLSSTIKNSGISKYFHEGPAITHDYRLNGKVSAIKITDGYDTNGKILFYEAKECKQDVRSIKHDVDEFSGKCDNNINKDCINDEIRSVLIFPDVIDNTIIKLYDSPSGKLNDDWAYIDRGTDNFKLPHCVNSLEKSTTSNGLITYYQKHNGLNGKVSYIKIRHDKDTKLLFFEGNDCKQNIELSLSGNTNHSGDSDKLGFQNDEISSMLIQAGVNSGRKIKVYDSKKGKTSDDYTLVSVGKIKHPVCVDTFEKDINKSKVDVKYHKHNGLDGKISYIKVY